MNATIDKLEDSVSDKKKTFCDAVSYTSEPLL